MPEYVFAVDVYVEAADEEEEIEKASMIESYIGDIENVKATHTEGVEEL